MPYPSPSEQNEPEVVAVKAAAGMGGKERLGGRRKRKVGAKQWGEGRQKRGGHHGTGHILSTQTGGSPVSQTVSHLRLLPKNLLIGDGD